MRRRSGRIGRNRSSEFHITQNNSMQYSFKKLNLIVGWLSFVLASTVYLLTMEPTASFWDCSEFIATSYKLEVGHPPRERRSS